MPVIINEIVFRGEVASRDRRPSAETAAPARPEIEPRRLIEECVEEVLRILERKGER